ncbi:acetate--CoA ligase family protein [Saccharopolyspora sp. NPDC049357]|uniref:acetate--CoA ligase family protein n=1 Tax=Saccharopolyspora sp. NPDC049357 TaxID=3154507 RepID=UPI00342FB518
MSETTDLTPLFAPSGIVVVGASRQSAKLGAVMARSLTGFTGELALVNSRNPEPDSGLHASVREAAEHSSARLDLAVLCVPAAACADSLADAAAAGCRAALICAGGFGEAGEAGQAHEDAVRRVAEETGIRLLGPNTSGFFVPHRGLTASFVPGARQLPAGGVAVVAASGGINHALSFELTNAGNGVSLGVGIGTGVDVTAADVLEYLVDDPETTAVALHLESVPDGPRLVRALRRLTEVKPVVALVVGRSDVAEFAQSHTGALATSWRTTRAAVAQAGAVVVDDERELVDALTALSRVRLRPAADPGLGIVTAQAGPGLLLADRAGADEVATPELAAETQGRLSELLPPLTFQRNPVDTGRPDKSFPAVLGAVAGDDAIDAVVVYALTEPDSVDLVTALQDAELPADVPAVVALGGLDDEAAEQRIQLHKTGVPAFATPTAAANALRALVADSRRQFRTGTAVERQVSALPGGLLDEHAAKNYLAELGIDTLPRRACANREEAQRALTELGGPVAVKLLDATVLHKTDVGGVHLGVRTPDELDAALEAIHAAIGATGYLVEAMAPSGVDLVVGAHRDPVFGPVVLVGLGGTAAEALGDVAVRLAPVTAAEAAEMPGELLGKELLRGWRGGPELNPQELGEVVAALAAVLTSHPEVTEIEINPLRLTTDGLVALDAVVVRTEEDRNA